MEDENILEPQKSISGTKKYLIENIKNVYGHGRQKKLIVGAKRNGSTIHMKCSVKYCSFNIIYRKVKENCNEYIYIQDISNPNV